MFFIFHIFSNVSLAFVIFSSTSLISVDSLACFSYSLILVYILASFPYFSYFLSTVFFFSWILWHGSPIFISPCLIPKHIRYYFRVSTFVILSLLIQVFIQSHFGPYSRHPSYMTRPFQSSKLHDISRNLE